MGSDDGGAVGGDGEGVAYGDLHAYVHRGFLQRDFRYFSDCDASECDGVSCAQSLYFEEVGEEGNGLAGGVGSIGAVGVREQEGEEEEGDGSVESVSDAMSPCEQSRGGELRGCWGCQGGGFVIRD